MSPNCSARSAAARAGAGSSLQILFVAALAWIAYEIVANARANLQAQRITAGFGFMANTAGFDVSQNLIPYSGSDSYTRVFLVGLLNTLLVSIIGIFFATIIGFLVALGRLSPNWLLSRDRRRLCRTDPQPAAAVPDPVLVSRGARRAAESAAEHLAVRQLLPQQPRLRDPKADRQIPASSAFVVAIVIAIVGSLLLRRYARKQLFRPRPADPDLALCAGHADRPAAADARWCSARRSSSKFPELKGFNFSGGSRVIPEFVALTLALSTYTAAFIAEIVRAGIQSVHKGQMEAGSSLGLQRGSTLRLIVVPQAMRVILPPLTNQYLNLTKNSSLAVAIGYPDLVSVFAGTTLSQTGQAIEIIAITMGVYLLISLVTSAIMSFYGWRLGRSLGSHERYSPHHLSSARTSFRSAPRRSRPPALSASCARGCSIRRPTS